MNWYHRCFAALIGLSVAASAGAAHAQAVLVGSTPASGAKVSSGDFVVHLQFNGLIDHVRSHLMLTHPDGSREYLQIAENGPPQELTALVRLTPGAYVLHWEVLQLGGHLTTGDLNFSANSP